MMQTLLQNKDLEEQAMEKSQQTRQFLSMPESKRYPRIFRLKTISLVVIILIVIVGILDLCFFIYMRQNREPSANVSFANDVITKTKTLSAGDQIHSMIRNILTAYPNFYYQHAEKLSSGPGANLTSAILRKEIFENNSNNILFLLRLQIVDSNDSYLIGLFSSSYFRVPGDNDYNSTIDYYTFDSASERQSILFSLANQQYLVMNGTTSTDQLLNCKTYVLSDAKAQFSFFSIFRKHLNSDILSLMEKVPVQCFDKADSVEEVMGKIRIISGLDSQSQAQISEYEVYGLKNKK